MLVGLAGSRVAVTARIDIADATLQMVAETLGVLRRNGATTVAGIVITDRPALASDIQTHLNSAAERAELDVFDVLLVSGNQWRSLHNADPECRAQQGNPLPAGPTAVDAAAVYAGLTVLPSRDALADILAPLAERPNLGAELRRHWGLRDAAGEDGELAGWERSAVRAPFAAQRAAKGGRMPTDDAAARFGVALRSHAVRDEVWLAIDDGRLQGTELWVDLARRLPHPYDAAPLFLAGWHAYRQGDGALAGIAADLAVVADPGTPVRSVHGHPGPRRTPSDPLGGHRWVRSRIDYTRFSDPARSFGSAA